MLHSLLEVVPRNTIFTECQYCPVLVTDTCAECKLLVLAHYRAFINICAKYLVRGFVAVHGMGPSIVTLGVGP